jgi:hypothetical protein
MYSIMGAVDLYTVLCEMLNNAVMPWRRRYVQWKSPQFIRRFEIGTMLNKQLHNGGVFVAVCFPECCIL